MPITLTPAGLAEFVAEIALAASHLFLGVLGFTLHRTLVPATRYFTLACAALAWATIWTAAQHVVGAAWPPALVLSTLLSGYAMPAFLLFIWGASTGRRRVPAAWLALGLPGTLFALVCLTVPDAMAFRVAFARGEGPTWHALVSPLYLLHSLSQVLSVSAAIVLLVRGLRGAATREVRRSMHWLLVAVGTAAICSIAFSWLPGLFRSTAALTLAPWATAPFSFLTYRALRIQAAGARVAYVGREAAETARRESVARAVAGLAESVGPILAEVESGLVRLESRSHLDESGRALLAGLWHQVARGNEIVDRIRRAREIEEPASEEVAPIVAWFVSRAPALPDGRPSAHLVMDDAGPGGCVRASAEDLRGLFGPLFDAWGRPGGREPLTVEIAALCPAVVPAGALGTPLDGESAVSIRFGRVGEPAVLEAVWRELAEGLAGQIGGPVHAAGVLLRSLGGALAMDTAARGQPGLVLWLPAAPDGRSEADGSPPPAHASVPLDEVEVVLVGPWAEIVEPLRLMLSARGVRPVCFRDIASAHAHMSAGGPARPRVCCLHLPVFDGATDRRLRVAVASLERTRFIVLTEPTVALGRSVADGRSMRLSAATPLDEVAALLDRARDLSAS
jgi:hypothetical protein